jgi:putative MATE family efflux protein
MTQSMTENEIPPSYLKKGNLREGSVTKHLVRLTVPMIWGIAAIISFQLVDMYFIARLGTEALAAVTFTFPITYIFLTLMIAMGIALSSIVSRLIGENRKEETYQITGHTLILAFIVGVVLSVSGYFLINPVFLLMGAGELQLGMIAEYMRVWLYSVPFIIVHMVGNSALRANGSTFYPAVTMSFLALLNAVLDPILIFGLLGAPELGIEGAALATVIANIIALCAALIVFIRIQPIFTLKCCLKLAGFGKTVKRVLVIAIPVGLTQAIQPLVNAFIIALLANYGSEAVAAMGVASRVEAFAFIVLMALSTGMAPVIGQNFGASNYNRVKETLHKAITFSCLWSFSIALLLGLAGEFVAGLFTDSAEVIYYARIFFWIVPFSYAFAHLVMGWSSAFNAMGLPQRSLAMIVVKMLVLMIPAVYIGSLYGVIGIFVAIAVVNTVAGVFFHFWSKSYLNKISQ